MPEFVPRCLCNIDHAGFFPPSQPSSFIGMSVETAQATPVVTAQSQIVIPDEIEARGRQGCRTVKASASRQ
jgi:hypothetical protein